MIKTGRFKAIPIEDRLCQICNTGAIEDEIHFVLKCPALNETRESYMRSFCDNFDMDGLTDTQLIKNMLDETNIKNMGHFLEALSEERKCKMYT